jgi:hypothetical protein
MKSIGSRSDFIHAQSDSNRFAVSICCLQLGSESGSDDQCVSLI